MADIQIAIENNKPSYLDSSFTITSVDKHCATIDADYFVIHISLGSDRLMWAIEEEESSKDAWVFLNPDWSLDGLAYRFWFDVNLTVAKKLKQAFDIEITLDF
jgi:hypothetical protein